MVGLLKSLTIRGEPRHYIFVAGSESTNVVLFMNTRASTHRYKANSNQAGERVGQQLLPRFSLGLGIVGGVLHGFRPNHQSGGFIELMAFTTKIVA